jgi:putative transposase
VYRYQPQVADDQPLSALLKQLAEDHPRWGLRKLLSWLRNNGYTWNHKHVRRVYRSLKLNLRSKPKKRLPTRSPQPLSQPEAINVSWSLDFMRDSLSSGRSFRTFNVLDNYNREALWIEIDTSLPAERVIRCLETIAAERSYPQRLRLDNGPEFIARKLANWATQHNIALDFIQPGKPAQNAYIERFNRTYRTEVLDLYTFDTLAEVRAVTEQWLEEYNQIRPHDALGGLTPAQYSAMTSP